ncbi:MAG TPA: STAS domain-containing protein [Kofleriaceae bacterium]|nr:STAS domain-containing protein [Kofleriaceae bacterium]
MSQKFQATVSHRDDVSYVKLAGVIDEDNELPGLVEKIPAGTAVIDLAEVERINSCGVRDWVNWLGRLETQRTRIVLVSCSPAIVAQINLVNNFTGAGTVKSFFVPYFCPECDQEKLLLAETSEMGPAPHEPPICRCDECDRVMDFDDLADSYFAFLSSQKAMVEADRVNGAIQALAPSTTDGKVRSRAPQSGGLAAATSSQVPALPSIRTPSRPPVAVPGPPSKSRPPAAVVGGFGGATGPGMRPVGTFPGTNPSGSRTGTAPGTGNGGGTGPGVGPGSNPGVPAFGAGIVADRPALVQPRSSTMIYVLVAVLLAAISVLTYLLVASK